LTKLRKLESEGEKRVNRVEEGNSQRRPTEGEQQRANQVGPTPHRTAEEADERKGKPEGGQKKQPIAGPEQESSLRVNLHTIITGEMNDPRQDARSENSDRDVPGPTKAESDEAEEPKSLHAES
jgi:hypothetical protein